MLPCLLSALGSYSVANFRAWAAHLVPILKWGLAPRRLGASPHFGMGTESEDQEPKLRLI